MSTVYCIYILLVNLVALTYTTQITSLRDIPALKNSETFIKNEREILDKINKVIRDGRDQLQIVSDFDQTLTADPGENGKTVLNSYEILRRLPSIPQSYKDEDTKLFYKYKPVEEDPNISIEEKSRYMFEWYKESENLLRGLQFPRKELENLAQNVSNSFRDRVVVLLKWSDENDVPVLVLSSGLGDAVVAILKAANLLTQNVKVISNFLNLDKEDTIIGYKSDPIHSYNKNEASIKNTEYYDTIKERHNVILLGDSIGDANMTEGIDNLETVIKIAFLTKKKRNNLEDYLNKFDIVICNDQTMDVVNAIINLV